MGKLSRGLSGGYYLDIAKKDEHRFLYLETPMDSGYQKMYFNGHCVLMLNRDGRNDAIIYPENICAAIYHSSDYDKDLCENEIISEHISFLEGQKKHIDRTIRTTSATDSQDANYSNQNKVKTYLEKLKTDYPNIQATKIDSPKYPRKAADQETVPSAIKDKIALLVKQRIEKLEGTLGIIRKTDPTKLNALRILYNQINTGNSYTVSSLKQTISDWSTENQTAIQDQRSKCSLFKTNISKTKQLADEMENLLSTESTLGRPK